MLIACLVFRVRIQRTESLVPFSRPPTHPSRVSMVSMVSTAIYLSNSHFGRPGAPLHHPMVVSHVVGVYGRISRFTRNVGYVWGVHPGASGLRDGGVVFMLITWDTSVPTHSSSDEGVWSVVPLLARSPFSQMGFGVVLSRRVLPIDQGTRSSSTRCWMAACGGMVCTRGGWDGWGIASGPAPRPSFSARGGIRAGISVGADHD